eukprot:snap_masked-scaffold_2-processed-gene-17.30-mRNA-1 protein AED:1.00 eAED:1.00 QI:0/0/0/0/1/1/3/0/93
MTKDKELPEIAINWSEKPKHKNLDNKNKKTPKKAKNKTQINMSMENYMKSTAVYDMNKEDELSNTFQQLNLRNKELVGSQTLSLKIQGLSKTL